MSLYIRTTRKMEKVREKFCILAKYFFSGYTDGDFLLYGVSGQPPEYGRFLYLRQLYENSAGTVITNTKLKEKVEPRLHFLFF